MSVLRITKKFGNILSKRQKIRIIELFILMIIGGFLEMCSVSMVLPFMDAVINPDIAMEKEYIKIICSVFHIHSSRTLLFFLAIVIACIYIIKNLYLLFEYYIQYHFVYGNMFLMQRQLLQTLLNRPYDYFLNINSGEIIRIISSDTLNSFNLLVTLLLLFTEVVVSAMLVITIFIISPIVTIGISLLLIVVLLIANSIIRPELKKAAQENQEAAAGMNKWLLQSIHGIKELKVMNKEAYFQENYDKCGWMFAQTVQKNQMLSIMPRFLIEALSMSCLFVVIALLIYYGKAFEMIVPILTAVVMAAIRILPSVNRISGSLAVMAFNEPMLDRMIENLNRIKKSNSDYRTGCKHMNAGIPKNEFPILHNEIKLTNITFKYSGSNIDVLNNANMEVKCGESVGIIGASGAGKTTVVDLILGLLKPVEGKILVDGIDINEKSEDWHNQIGYIPQTIFMLDDTIRANVAFGEKIDSSDDSRIWKALEDASVAEFVRSLPDGLDTQIGERGARLSGGQKQRIGIARALYRDPKVLVFDEATSALDHETESEIMESIYHLHGQKTMIIIAHRLSTVKKCDHIFRVEKEIISMER